MEMCVFEFAKRGLAGLKCGVPMKVMGRALRYFWADAPRLAGMGALLLLSLGASLLKPWPVAIILDSVLGAKPLPEWLKGVVGREVTRDLGVLLGLAAMLFIVHAGHGVLSAAQNYIAIGIGLRGLRWVRNDVFACLQRLSLKFHHGRQTGDLIYRAAWDTYSFQTLFQQGLVTFVTALLTLVLMVGVMARLNGLLTLVALATIPLLVLSIRIFGREMTRRGAAAQQADSQVTSMVQQSLSLMPLVQSYAREEKQQEMFTAQTAEAEAKRLSQHGWELLYWLGVTIVFALGVTATVLVGALQVKEGRLSVGGLWIFLAYLAQFYEPLNQLSHMGATVSTAKAAVSRVFEILDTPEEVKDAPNARPVVRGAISTRKPLPDNALVVRGHIAFESVSFHYQPGKLVLRDISFTLEPGTRTAVIGPSGAGKSTLMNLLPRFYDPVAGAIKLDGADLRELKLKELRAQIAVVLQEPMLLPGTIADNIAYGKPGATLDEIQAAAMAANAHEFIERLPQKYQTRVGEGEARLSVGERQRLSIARAFLKDAPILLLDEPTSALDAESEAVVVKSLFDLMRGRTTLLIAHRLSTIKNVEQVLVLEDGILTEKGSPEELLRKQGGYFARVAKGQVEIG